MRLDHSKYIPEFLKAGIRVLAPTDYWNENSDKWWFQYGERFDETRKSFKVGGFTVYPFQVQHNVPCYGFYITHKDFGNLIYATDTCYIKQNFNKLKPQHILIECNYQKDMVDVQEYKYEHELKDHMERSTCIDFIKANATDSLQNIVLCHLSQSAIDDVETLDLVKKEVKSSVHIATKGLLIELVNKDVCPFL